MKKKLKIDYEQVKQLACQGYNVKTIAEVVGICRSLAYENLDFMDAYKKGRQELTDSLAKSMLSKAVAGDVTTQIFLAKRLGLFEKSQPQIKLQSAEDALKAFEEVFNADISVESKNALKSVLESFTRTLGITEQDRKIRELETMFEKLRTQYTQK